MDDTVRLCVSPSVKCCISICTLERGLKMYISAHTVKPITTTPDGAAGYFHNTYLQLPNSFYTRQGPTPLKNPRMVATSASSCALLDMQNTPANRAALTQIGSGQSLWPGSQPLAMVYSGHQFGSYNPRLGDGRGLLLGEWVNTRNEKWDLHLKGAGPTPYSRFGDGRAVLRSCIREFLASEALHNLGIPTTRALCVITSDTPVQRETIEAGSTLLRLARSHIRFGHFEYCYYRGLEKKEQNRFNNLRELTDYTIWQNYPALKPGTEDGYLGFFTEVVRRSAILIAKWQAAGFAHGVMNTDNMSIIGDTFDYGPYGFMDDFNWNYICNHSDYYGRYAFSQQPEIGYWNCHKLGQALTPLFSDTKLIQQALHSYTTIYTQTYLRLMLDKIGLVEQEPEDTRLIQELLQQLHHRHCDYTRFFRTLCRYPSDSACTALQQQIGRRWLDNYQERLKSNPLDDLKRQQRMMQVNPKYILRNYLAQQAITLAEQGDFEEISRLMTALATPFSEQPDLEHYAAEPPPWGKTLAVSCSS